MQKFDVAVIGLGAMGSATLFHLARQGCRVIGLERFEPGHDRGSSHGESRAIRLGYFEHPSYVPLLRRAYENWRELERLSEESLLTVTGVLEIGKPGSAIVAGSAEASLLHDLPHTLLDANEVMLRFPQFTLPPDFSAVWQPDGGYLLPERAVHAYLALAQSYGAEVLTGTQALGIDPYPAGVRIALADGAVEADRVVVAAGPWIGDLVPALAPDLQLTRQVLVWFEPRDPKAVQFGNLPVFIIDAPGEIAYGFPQISQLGFKCASHLSSGTVGHADEARQNAGMEDAAVLRRFLEAYLPGAAGPVRAMKTCLYTKTPDEDFVLDCLPEDSRIVIASPCSGHGFKFASVIGEVLADLALHGSTPHDIGRFRMSRPGLNEQERQQQASSHLR